MSAQRIDEVVRLLESFLLGEIDLPEKRITAALRLLDWAIPDASPLDDGAEVLMSADLAFPRKFSA
jgi:hypothetical protein